MKVGIVGATGLVGEELLGVLAEREFPISALHLFASERSVGKQLSFGGAPVRIEATRIEALRTLDVLFLSAGASVSRAIREDLGPIGPMVFDNTSAFRLDPATPLVVPEVNPEAMTAEARWFAVANCTAILLCLALGPLDRAFGLEWANVSTYQAISGAGRRSLDRLLRDLRLETTEGTVHSSGTVSGEGPTLAFNVLPSIGTADGGIGSFTGEEEKVAAETRKILGRPGLALTATCVRVPVLRAHAESVEVQLGTEAELGQVREVLRAAPGVEIREGITPDEVPTPRSAAGHDGILVGRIRSGSRPGRVLLFLTGDQLRKGAALNAVQVAELALKRSPPTSVRGAPGSPA